MPGKHAVTGYDGDYITDRTYNGPIGTRDDADHQHTDDPNLRTGYTAAGVARRAEPAHRKRGFHTYIRGSLTWFDAYDQS